MERHAAGLAVREIEQALLQHPFIEIGELRARAGFSNAHARFFVQAVKLAQAAFREDSVNCQATVATKYLVLLRKAGVRARLAAVKAIRARARGVFAPGRRRRNHAGCVARTAHSVRACLGCLPGRVQPACFLSRTRGVATPRFPKPPRTRPQNRLARVSFRGRLLTLHFLASAQHDLRGRRGGVGSEAGQGPAR